jgi:hypothetical protein
MTIAEPGHPDHRNRAWRSPNPDIPITETGMEVAIA